MTEEEKWLVQAATDAADAATIYPEQAFYLALAEFVRAEAWRAELARGEIDGRIWNHEAW